MARSHGRRMTAAVFAALILAAVPVGAALGADATGCSGSAVSSDADGNLLDKMSAPGSRGTFDEPFVVDLDGTVSWQGSTPVALQDGSWSVTVGGFPVASGDMQNGEAVTTKSGDSEISELPAAAKAPLEGQQKVPVVVDISTATGDCSATIYVTTDQPPTFTPLWWTGVALMMLAVLLLWLLLSRTVIIWLDPDAAGGANASMSRSSRSSGASFDSGLTVLDGPGPDPDAPSHPTPEKGVSS